MSELALELDEDEWEEVIEEDHDDHDHDHDHDDFVVLTELRLKELIPTKFPGHVVRPKLKISSPSFPSPR